MMKWPPPLRFAIPLAVLLFGVTAGLITQRYGRKFETETIEKYAEERAELVGTQLSTMAAYLIEIGPAFGVQREVALSAIDRDLQVALVVGGNDRVMFASRYDWQNLPIERTPAGEHEPFLTRARDRRAGIVAFSPDRNRLIGAFPFPITRRSTGVLRESEVGVVFLQYDLRHRKAVAAAAATRRDWLAVGVILALCAAVSLLFGPMLTNRVRRLARAASQLAAGDLSARSDIRGGDELAQVSVAIDEMASHLERSNAELRETEARFQFLVDGIPQVFWFMEIEPERFIYVGRSFERVWGRPVAELYEDANAWSSYIHRDDRARASQSFLSWITGRATSFDETYRVCRPDGEERWVRDRGIRLEPSKDGRPRVAGLAEDITAEHLRIAAQVDLDRKLRETQKLESLGVLAGGIAHDFNNLLAGILGNASMAREEAAPDNPVQPYLEHIESAAVRAAELCKQMLAYSGKGRFEVQRIDLAELVRETAQLIQLSVNQNFEIRFDLPEGLPAIEADPTQMRQVIMNLVVNAGEAIAGPSGVVTVSAGTFAADADYFRQAVLSPALPAGNYVFLDVIDTGSGISAENKTRIFEPFFTTKFAGRGLGLSAVLGIVRGHGGALRVDSEENKGSTFRLILPIAEGDPEPLESEDRVEPWTGSGTILIVDDDEAVRTVAMRMVQKLGFTSLVAQDGRAGVEVFRSNPDGITAVLMDLTMPHMDGEQAFQEMRAIRPDLRVILMSGFNEQDAIHRFSGKGLAGFLQKPFRPDSLRRKLRDVCETRA